MTYDEMFAIILAAKEGKQIQFKNHGCEWEDYCGHINFNFFAVQYRVKPEPKYQWVMQNSDGSTHLTVRYYAEEPKVAAHMKAEIVCRADWTEKYE